jgi:hypothetical protein
MLDFDISVANSASKNASYFINSPNIYIYIYIYIAFQNTSWSEVNRGDKNTCESS